MDWQSDCLDDNDSYWKIKINVFQFYIPLQVRSFELRSSFEKSNLCLLIAEVEEFEYWDKSSMVAPNVTLLWRDEKNHRSFNWVWVLLYKLMA